MYLSDVKVNVPNENPGKASPETKPGLETAVPVAKKKCCE
jgi:hypothetical protein